MLQEIVRHDPAYGSEMRAVELRLANLQQQVAQLTVAINKHTESHPDKINQFDRRITRLETQVELNHSPNKR